MKSVQTRNSFQSPTKEEIVGTKRRTINKTKTKEQERNKKKRMKNENNKSVNKGNAPTQKTYTKAINQV